MKKRLYVLLIALAMVVTYMPAMAFAETEEGNVRQADIIDKQMEFSENEIIGNSSDDRTVENATLLKNDDVQEEASEPDFNQRIEQEKNAVKAAEYDVLLVASGKCGDNLSWSISDNGVLTISGTGDMYDYKEDGEDETELGESPFSYKSEIKSLVVKEGVTSIGRYAFDSCEELKTIYLPKSLRTKREYAFFACHGITDVYYAGSAEEWYSVNKEYSWWTFEEAALHVNYGTEKADYLSIVMHLKGGTLNNKRDVVFVEIPKLTTTYKLSTPVRSGYVLDGWVNSSDYSEYEDYYDEDAYINNIAAGTKGLVEIYAIWSSDSDYAGKENIKTDIPPAVVGKAFEYQPFRFADDDYKYTVSYFCKDKDYQYVRDYPLTQLSNKYGLNFGSDGKISGIPNESASVLLTACVSRKDNDGNVAGYREYSNILLNITDSVKTYDIPSNVKKIDFMNVNANDWYKHQEEGDNLGLPGYVYSVKAGQTEWVEFTASSANIHIEARLPIHLIGRDGIEREEYEWDTFYYFCANPGEKYYLYADNSKGTEDKTVYLTDAWTNIVHGGGLGNWDFAKTGENVNKKFDGDSNTTWDVYKVGNLNSSTKWSVKGMSAYAYMYFCSSLSVISKGSVYYENPKLECNFGQSQSLYRRDDLTESEEAMDLADGEKHHKVNYTFHIADYEYNENRTSSFTVDVYVPAGETLYRGEDGFLHTGIYEHVHDSGTLEHFEAKKATVDSEGNIEYWKCKVCGKCFADSEGKNEITRADTVIDKLTFDPDTECEHKWDTKYTLDTAATCTKAGSESIHCTICGAVKKGSSRDVPAAGHSYGAWKTTKAVTELAAGQKTRTCAVCGNVEKVSIAKLAPTLPKVKIAKPAAAKKAVTVKWKKVSKTNLKKIKKVEVQVSTTPNFSTLAKTKQVSAKKTSCKIKGLKSKQKYYVRVRAYTNGHVSAWSAVKSFKAK